MNHRVNNFYYQKTLIFIFVILGFVTTKAEQITVRQTPSIKQLPSNTILCLFQDKEGFIWFGTTDGLCRYDGYHVITFRGDINNPALLTNDEITCITEDNNNQLWIGTHRGLNILNKKNYQITHFEGEELQNSIIRNITTTSDGFIWVGTNGRLHRYNDKMVLQKSYENDLPATGINCIYEDKEGNLWVSLWEKGLHKYDPEQDSFIPFPSIGSGNNPFSVFQDSKMNYWICTWGNGIYRFYPDQEAEDMYLQESPFNEDKEISTAAFYSIVEDNTNHHIWAMSFSGLYIFEYNDDNNLRRIPTPKKLQETNNIFNQMIKDRTGNLWIGTFNEGVINVIFDNPLIRNNSLDIIKEKTGLTPNIQTLYEDKEGDIWFHQNRFGAGIYFPSENKTLFHTDIPALDDIIGLSCITDFRSYPDEIWLGFIYSPFICRLHKKGKDIRLIEQIDLGKTESNPGNPRIFFEDRKNNIWIITTERLFLKPYYTDSIQVIRDITSKVTGITEDTRGDIWLSSLDQGIFRITTSPDRQKDNLLIRNYTPQNSALEGYNFEDICADSKGQIWIGTKEGNVLVYDIITEEFTNISHLFSLSDERLLNILTDSYGHIWISTAKRLIEFNPETKAIYDYSEEDGIIINSFLKNSYRINQSGEILFGGNKGISIIKPANKPIEKKKR